MLDWRSLGSTQTHTNCRRLNFAANVICVFSPAVQEERNPATGKVCGSRKEDDSPIGSPVSSVQQVAGSVVAASPVSSWGMAASVPAGSKNITTLLSRSPTDGLGSATAQLTLPALLDAERAWEDDKETKTPITTPADFGDIVATTKDQLFLSIAWAKNVPAFSSLHVDDQVWIVNCTRLLSVTDSAARTMYH